MYGLFIDKRDKIQEVIELAVKLRLTRKGKRKQPFYRIVAADSRSRRDGKYIEKIGYYNPLTDPAEIMIDEEKAFYWLKNGAIPTATVESLFSKKGIMLKWHHFKQGSDGATVEEEYKKWEVLQLERQKQKDALAAQAKLEQEQKVTEQEAVSEAAEPEVIPEAVSEAAEPEVIPEAISEAAEPEVIPEATTDSEATPPQEQAAASESAEKASEPLPMDNQADEEQKSAPEQATETDETEDK